jgi:hypothetical protein
MRRCQDCIAEGLPSLFDRDSTGTWRCPRHQAQVNAGRRAKGRAYEKTRQRPTSTQRGYGAVYQKRRNAIVARALATGEACVLCGRPCLPGQAITAQHIDGDAATGDPATVRLGPAHRSCNRRGR